VQVQLILDDTPDGKTTVSGDVMVSLKRLGIKDIKAPLGAFKVADDIAIAAKLVVLPA